MSIVIVGEEHTKRMDFFLQAAKEEGISVQRISWKQVCRERLEGAAVKLDPPFWEMSELEAAEEEIAEYQKKLAGLKESHCVYLNTPSAIGLALDKYICKKKLMEKEIAVTPMFPDVIYTIQELREQMERENIYQVFLKPRYGSGAAGVMAYRSTKDWKHQQLFTSCIVVDGKTVNTKRLRKFEQPQEIEALVSRILSLGVVAEHWIPKAVHQGKIYDLRVVWQFGHRSFVIARGAKGPITNLHLNNGAIDFKELGLSREELGEIDRLCRQTVEALPGLSMAGIDIALEKNSHKPYVIEVNGQGDLLYQDIYKENRIYREQVREMNTWHSQLI